MEPIHCEKTCVVCIAIAELEKCGQLPDLYVETFFVTKRDKYQDRITRTKEKNCSCAGSILLQSILIDMALMTIKDSPTKRDISWTSKCRFSGKKLSFNLMMIGSPDVERFQEYLLRTAITTDVVCKCGTNH